MMTILICTVIWKALGRDCTNNNGLILKIGVLSFDVIDGDLYHTVFPYGIYIYI